MRVKARKRRERDKGKEGRNKWKKEKEYNIQKRKGERKKKKRRNEKEKKNRKRRKEEENEKRKRQVTGIFIFNVVYSHDRCFLREIKLSLGSHHWQLPTHCQPLTLLFSIIYS